MSDNKHISIDEIWPQERDYMERPDRYKYVRKIIKPETCVFCTAAEAEAGFESLCLYKSKYSMTVLNKYPYNNGHSLVIPLRHVGDMDELSEEEYLDLSWLLRKSFSITKKVYDCAGLNMGMNHGKVAGAGVPDHLHWHIVPRWLGDTNFFPLIAETKAHPESLDQSYDKLKTEFDKL